MNSTRAMRFLCATVVAAVLALLPFAGAHAQNGQPNPLKVTYVNLTLQHDSIRAKSAAANTVGGNDTLRYDLTFTNSAKNAVGAIVFNNEIPKGLMLIAGTVTTSAPAKVEYSIDGGHEYSAKPMMTVLEGGRTIQRVAPTSMYTHIRWTLKDSVAPGASVTARYETTVGVRNSR